MTAWTGARATTAQGLPADVQETLEGVLGLALLAGLVVLVTVGRVRRLLDERRMLRSRRAWFTRLDDDLHGWHVEAQACAAVGDQQLRRAFLAAHLAAIHLASQAREMRWYLGEGETEERFAVRALEAVMERVKDAADRVLSDDGPVSRDEVDGLLAAAARREERVAALIRRELGASRLDEA